MKIINIYLILISILSLITMSIDKLLAIKHKRRISEFNLLSLSFIGGSLGILFGMIIFNHKTRKPKFLILIPSSLLILILVYIKLKETF